jgi:Beta-lactamase enzyme family
MTFFKQDEQLEHIALAILETTWDKYPELARDRTALTWIVYDPPYIVNTGGAISAEEFWKYPIRGYSYRGMNRIYPASIVKLFYLVAIHEWLEGEMIPESEELHRAMRDMIIDSSNDATSLVIDVLTGTTSGPELPAGPFETWKSQRNIVNRYFQSLGWEEFKAINVNQKPWSDGPYGRERAFLGEMMENRNMLTTNAVARLLHTIIGGIAVSSARSQQMMELLKRSLESVDLDLASNDDENQVTGFLGEGLPKGAKIWSKAGWTSQVRHDAAYIEIPDRKPYSLVVFTESKASEKRREILPFISHSLATAMENV